MNGELIPSVRAFDQAFRPVHIQSGPETRGGGTAINTLGEPRWAFDLVTRDLTADQLRIWTAWIARRQGRRFTFTAWRMDRPLPQAGGVSSDALLDVGGINRAAGTVSLTGTGAYTASPGDMLSYYTAAQGYWLGEIMAPATAQNDQITVEVSHPPLPPHASQASPRRIRALGEFELISHTLTEQKDRRSVQISAKQLIRG